MPWGEWTASLAAWRHRFRVPEAVFLGDDDQRLRLDLNEKAHQQLLRAHLDRAGHATLREAPAVSAYGWLDGRAHEITLPLASTHRPAPAPARRRPVTIGREQGKLPGASEWAFVKLYGHPDRQADILTTCLPALWESWENGPPEWWFVRYHDPEPHLRLRIRLPHPDDWGRTVQRVGTWAADLRSLGLAGRVQWDTYYPETGRYGTSAAMAAAETVFAADSTAAIVQLHAVRGGSPAQAVTAASMVDLACSFIGTVPDGMRWLVGYITRTTGPAPARDLHDQAVCLADPSGGFPALRDVPGGDRIAGAWERRRTALAAYRNRLTDAGVDPDAVLASLLHMHHIRVHGIDEECEHACHRLARSAALAWTARGAEQ